jgi:hypothetical protein
VGPEEPERICVHGMPIWGKQARCFLTCSDLFGAQ